MPTPQPATPTPVPVEAILGFEIEKADSLYQRYQQYIHSFNVTITESNGVDVELANVQLCYEQPFGATTELKCRDLDQIVIEGNGEHTIVMEFETTDSIKEAILKYSRFDKSGQRIDEDFIIGFLKDDDSGGDGGGYSRGEPPGGGWGFVWRLGGAGTSDRWYAITAAN